MGIYNLNHFKTKKDALRYYAKGMRDFSEKALECLEKEEPDFAEAERNARWVDTFYKHYYATLIYDWSVKRY